VTRLRGSLTTSMGWLQLAIYYRLYHIMTWFFHIGVFKMRADHLQFMAIKLQQRLKQKTPGNNFISYIVEGNKGKPLSDNDLLATATTIANAGNDTSASALTATTFFLLRNPRTYNRLVEEVRSSFTRNEDITMVSTNQLRYLQAVIQESLRLYPPVPCSLPRWVPGKGEIIEGKWVPGGVSDLNKQEKKIPVRLTDSGMYPSQIAVGVHQLATNHSERNFHRANEFIPERWLERKDSEFANDDRAASQPFSVGSRNCIGMK
jgi:cytochrome P450